MEAVTSVEHGHVRIGLNTVTEPAHHHVARDTICTEEHRMEDLRTSGRTSIICDFQKLSERART